MANKLVLQAMLLAARRVSVMHAQANHAHRAHRICVFLCTLLTMSVTCAAVETQPFTLSELHTAQGVSQWALA